MIGDTGEDPHGHFNWSEPSKWSRRAWVEWAVFAIIWATAQTLIRDEDWGSAGHQVLVGIALVQLAIIGHLIAYPETVTIPLEMLESALTVLWALIPTIPWEPWHVTTSTGGLAGPLFIVNGLWGVSQA